MRLRLTAALLTLALLLQFEEKASAILVIDITGTPGSGQTQWVFSGAATAGGGGFFDDDSQSSADSWQDIGEFTTLDDWDEPESVKLGGSATVSVANVGGTITRIIDPVYVDSDDSSPDDIGISVSEAESNSNLDFVTGDVVSWTGILISNIDVNDLVDGFVGSTSNYAGTEGVLDLRVSITAIPEPGCVAFGTLVLGLSLCRRRRQ